MRLGPKALIQIGSGLKDIKPGLDYEKIEAQDKEKAQQLFQKIASHLRQNDNFDVTVKTKEQMFAFDSTSNTNLPLGGFYIVNKKTSTGMGFGIHFQKYNNGKYSIAVVADKDLDGFSKEYSRDSYEEFDNYLQEVVDDIFSSMEEASMMLMGSHKDIELSGKLTSNGQNMQTMLEGTPYFKARVPNDASEAIKSYANENENVSLENGVVTVKRDEITQYDINDQVHARNLFEVTQMIKAQKVS